MYRIIEEITYALVGLGAALILVTSTSAHTSLLGLGMIVAIGVLRLKAIESQQRHQTELLLLVVEGQDDAPGR